MTNSLRYDDSGSRIYDPEFFIFGCGCDATSVTIERHTVDYICVTIYHVQSGTFAYIPNDHQVVKAGTDEDIFSGRMPFNVTDSSFVSMQIHEPFCEIIAKTSVWYVPQLDGAIIGARGYDIVVERVPFYVENRSSVTCYFPTVKIKPSSLFDGEDEEGAAAGDLCDDGNELGVDGAEVRIVGVARDRDVVVALLPLHRQAVHMPELGAPNPAEP